MRRRLKLSVLVLAGATVLSGVAAAASSPGIATGPVSATTDTSVALHGTVNPNGASTSYRFDYGLTRFYGLETSLSSAGGGTKAVSVAKTIGGLLPGTGYHYLLYAVNKYGQVVGSDRTFRTHGNPPPQAVTGPATALSSSGAVVTGIINPHGESTSYNFQYGPSPFLGAQSFSGTVPAGSVPVIVSAQLQGLESGTTFYYRLEALHGSSVFQYGNEATFVTYPSPRPGPGIRANTTPRRDRKAPYVFTTSGQVSAPRSIPASVACSQTPTGLLRFYLGRREVASSLVLVQPDCRFLTQTTFRHLPGRGPKHRRVHLQVFFRFRGDPYLAPVGAHPQTVTLG